MFERLFAALCRFSRIPQPKPRLRRHFRLEVYALEERAVPAVVTLPTPVETIGAFSYMNLAPAQTPVILDADKPTIKIEFLAATQTARVAPAPEWEDWLASMHQDEDPFAVAPPRGDTESKAPVAAPAEEEMNWEDPLVTEEELEEILRIEQYRAEVAAMS